MECGYRISPWPHPQLHAVWASQDQTVPALVIYSYFTNQATATQVAMSVLGRILTEAEIRMRGGLGVEHVA